MAALEDVGREFKRIDAEARRVTAPLELGPNEFLELVELSRRRSRKGREALEALGGDPALIGELMQQLAEVEKPARKLENDLGMRRGDVYVALERLDSASHFVSTGRVVHRRRRRFRGNRSPGRPPWWICRTGFGTDRVPRSGVRAAAAS